MTFHLSDFTSEIRTTYWVQIVLTLFFLQEKSVDFSPTKKNMERKKSSLSKILEPKGAEG